MVLEKWHDELYEFGFYLGKFIYFIDAYEKKQFEKSVSQLKEVIESIK